MLGLGLELQSPIERPYYRLRQVKLGLLFSFLLGLGLRLGLAIGLGLGLELGLGLVETSRTRKRLKEEGER
eukprot:1379220-Amorphochlora_amoeboformis.AAC.1